MRRRVEFCETDLAGIVHFSNFLRYVESTEHAWFRSLGTSVHETIEGRLTGWPRVEIQCAYLSPLRFEEEIEVRLTIREIRDQSLTYDFVINRLDGDDQVTSARGSTIIVCATFDAASGRLKATKIPRVLRDKFESD